MISAAQISKALVDVLGGVPKRLPLEKAAAALTQKEVENRIELSAYGFVKTLFNLAGAKMLRPAALTNSGYIATYVQEAISDRICLPQLLLNAGSFVETLSSPEGGFCIPIEDLLKKLEIIAEPHIIYILFCSSNKCDLVSKYLPATIEYCRTYPGSFQELPEPFKVVKEVLLDEQHSS